DANNQLIQFNRIITTIEAIRNMGTGTVTATSNWFGSNSNPASKLFNNGSGVINCSSWLVLTLTANSTLIKAGGTSIITADLLHDSQGVCYDPNSGHVPDGISVDFETSLGTIDTQSAIVNGIAKSTLNGGSVNGGAAVSSIVDSQISQISVNVDTISPTAAVNIPGGLYNTNKTIILSINEPGTIYYTINGDIPTTTSRKYIEPISIMSTTILRFMAVDLAGNPSTVYSQTYTIDKIPPKVISTYPKRYATGVSRTRTIYLKFSEKIKKGSYWSKIMVKNKYGHAVSISKSISGNTIYIKTSKRGSYSYYTVYIPSAAVKDYAGNKLAKGYSFKFKTGR
ncbi:MAG TPA: Ig-like domain-containing protein, partial [Methanobacterium sp.]|nr:Ig-like domain-containing protein [Methanobacterium sp.]